MRIASFGAGGVGGYFGGRLAQAGHAVAFIARDAHLQAIQRDGLRVDSIAGDFVVRPAEATDTPAAVGPVDVVLVCVKAWQVPDVARALPPLLGPDTCVVPLGNGVEAPDQIAEVIGADRVLPGLCRLMTYVAAPGHIKHAGVDPVVEFGERGAPPSPRVKALRAAFEKAVGLAVKTPDDIELALWEKFLFIAPFSGMGALTRVPAGAMRGVAETRAMLEAAMREVVALAQARGVGLGEEAVRRTLAFVDGLPAHATASMQRDIMEGRPSELEYQTGAVVRLGLAAGVSVPVNECIYRGLLPMELAARGRVSEPR